MKAILPHLFLKVEFDLVGSSSINENEILNCAREFDNAVEFFDENKDQNNHMSISGGHIGSLQEPFSIAKNSNSTGKERNIEEREGKGKGKDGNMNEVNSLNTDKIISRTLLGGDGSSSINSYSTSNNESDSPIEDQNDSNTAILEVMKYITIPNSLINKSVLLKVNILKKNYFSYETQLKNQNKNLINIFESGAYLFNEEYTPVKTLFKELKVIRPISISNVTQYDLTPESSLIQLKFKNTTNTVDFEDKSLKLSKFLKGNRSNQRQNVNSVNTNADLISIINDHEKEKETEHNKQEYRSLLGIDLQLSDCQVLKEESIIESNTVIDVKNLEQVVNKEDIPFESFEFTIVNKEFPSTLRGGEDFNLCIKITKTIDSYDSLMDSIIKQSQSNSDIIESKFTPSIVPKARVHVLDQEGKDTYLNSTETSNKKNSGKTLNNVYTGNNDSISRLDTESKQFFFEEKKSVLTQIINEQSSQSHLYSNNVNTGITSLPKASQIISQINTSLSNKLFNWGSSSNNNIGTNRTSIIANTYESNNDKQEGLNTFSDTNTTMNNINTNNKSIPESAQKTKIEKRQVIEETKKMDFSKNLVKLIVRTPVLISIKADKFYDSLFMNIPVSWKTEISKFIRVDLLIKTKPIIHKNFIVQLMVKNLSSRVINLELYITTGNNSQKGSIPSMLSEYRYKKIGDVEPHQNRLVEVNFLPVKDGFNDLPSIAFVDRANEMVYSSISSNRIYVFSN